MSGNSTYQPQGPCMRWLERRLPIVAVPTTYSGSEMTGIWGITEGERKRTGRDPSVTPCLVVYDPEGPALYPPS